MAVPLQKNLLTFVDMEGMCVQQDCDLEPLVPTCPNRGIRG